MDYATLSALAEQARTYTDQVAGAAFTVRRPTVDAFRVWVRAHRRADGSVDWDAVCTENLPVCVVGWSGVTLRHFGADADTAVPFDHAAVGMLLADNKEVQLHLFRGLLSRMSAKMAALEPDEKNSSGVSTPA